MPDEPDDASMPTPGRAARGARARPHRPRSPSRGAPSRAAVARADAGVRDVGGCVGCARAAPRRRARSGTGPVRRANRGASERAAPSAGRRVRRRPTMRRRRLATRTAHAGARRSLAERATDPRAPSPSQRTRARTAIATMVLSPPPAPAIPPRGAPRRHRGTPAPRRRHRRLRDAPRRSSPAASPPLAAPLPRPRRTPPGIPAPPRSQRRRRRTRRRRAARRRAACRRAACRGAARRRAAASRGGPPGAPPALRLGHRRVRSGDRGARGRHAEPVARGVDRRGSRRGPPACSTRSPRSTSPRSATSCSSCATATPSPSWIESTQPALRSLRAMAAQMELTDLCSALDEFCVGVDAAVGGRARIDDDGKAELLRRYQRLIELIPQAFELDAERDRREPIIVEALLYQIDGVEKRTIEKLFAVGPRRLDALMQRDRRRDRRGRRDLRTSSPRRSSSSSGPTAVGASVGAAAPDPLAERRQLGDLLIMMSVQNDEFNHASTKWTDDARARKREAAQAARADVPAHQGRAGAARRARPARAARAAAVRRADRDARSLSVRGGPAAHAQPGKP